MHLLRQLQEALQRASSKEYWFQVYIDLGPGSALVRILRMHKFGPLVQGVGAVALSGGAGIRMVMVPEHIVCSFLRWLTLIVPAISPFLVRGGRKGESHQQSWQRSHF